MGENLSKIKKEKLNGVTGGYEGKILPTLKRKRDPDGNVYYVVYNDSSTIVLATRDRDEAIRRDRQLHPQAYGLTPLIIPEPRI